jgi:alpha-tubulin suppressor-like RCC1 family protein
MTIRLSLGARHSAIIDINNNCYTFGWNKYLQLYHSKETTNNNDNNIIENNEIIDSPVRLTMFNDEKTDDILCGPWFTLIYLN